jgi:hypothetical protein
MRKLLQLVFAVWKTDKPFDPEHYPWEAVVEEANEKATGHNPGSGPERSVVTAAVPSIAADAVESQATTAAGPAQAETRVGGIDYAALRRQVSLEAVLAEQGWLSKMKGSGSQRRGPCPIHARQQSRDRSFSVNLDKNVFRCFKKECAAQGNVLDLWMALKQLPLYEAAVQLAQTFGIDLTEQRGTEKRNP